MSDTTDVTTDAPISFFQHAERLSEYDESLYLGHLCWYAVSDSSAISHKDFCQQILGTGSNFSLPGTPHPADIFRRVTTDNARKKVQTAVPGIFSNYFFTEVGKDEDNIYRILVQQTVDTGGHVLSHENVWEVRFQRDTTTIHETELVANAPGMNIIQDVKDQFKDQQDTITPMTIRAWIRKAFIQLAATTVRPSGGVYFVAERYSPDMHALDKIIENIPNASFHALPLIDDKKQRGMLKQAFEDESVGEADSLIAEMREILTSGKKISVAKHADFVGRWKEMKGKIHTYSDILDDAMETTASRVEIIQKMLAGDMMGALK